MKTTSYYNRFPNRDSKRRPSEYEIIVLITLPQHSFPEAGNAWFWLGIFPLHVTRVPSSQGHLDTLVDFTAQWYWMPRHISQRNLSTESPRFDPI